VVRPRYVANSANQRPAFLGLTSVPGPLPRPTRGDGDETAAGHWNQFENRCHSREARRDRQISTPEGLVILGVRAAAESAALVGAPTRLRWGSRDLTAARSGWSIWHHCTARRACPAAPVDSFAHRAAPDRADRGGRSVRFRTSFPTRRPGRRCSAGGSRGTAIRKPFPRKGH
jgi:hypothetical protein